MKRPRAHIWHLTVVAVATCMLAVAMHDFSAWSQAARTIRIVVPFPPGSAADILARLLADRIAPAHKLTIVVDNRAGAGSVIGTETVARAAPDGNTWLIATNAFVINPQVRKLNYDPLLSFEPVCSLVQSPQVIAVNSASPYRSLADLFAAARTRPGELTIAGIGPASSTQIAFEILKRAADINMTFVPFPGVPPVVNALLGEHVTAMFGNYTAAVEQVRAGRLRALAVATRTRVDALPDVPTIAESGFKDYQADLWFALFVPAKTPNETVAQVTGWMTEALQAPEVRGKLEPQGLFPVGLCGAEFAAYLRKQHDDYGRVIRDARIKGE